MPLKTLVKVGSITNLSDARYCAGMGVDFLGFRVIQDQPGAISPKSFQEIRGWVTGPQIVAELYGIQDIAQLHACVEDYRPDYVELGLKELTLLGSVLTLPFILFLEDGEELPGGSLKPAYVVMANDASSITRLIPEHDVLLTIKTTDELGHALSQTGISGVCLHGGAEIRPGLKTYDELADILEALEVEE